MKENIYKQIESVIQKDNKVNVRTIFENESGLIKENMVKDLLAEDNSAFKTKPEIEKEDKKTIFYEPIACEERLIILGGGHIALPLSEFASKIGFNVVIVDDRPSFANTVRFPWASKVICDSFQKAIRELNISEADYIVIITRGHKHDADCLRALLDMKPTTYLGMIGSRRRVKGLLEMLEEEGFSRKRMDEIHTPIGLSIGAILPEEIAISILSELIYVKRVEKKDSNNKITTDLDLEVLRYLNTCTEALAIVTVIETKGSTPREAGAKMVVNKYGFIRGSIGGGCAEKDVINEAINIVGTGRYLVYNINMTGEVAENDGMVCGGIMKVLIEDYIF